MTGRVAHLPPGLRPASTCEYGAADPTWKRAAAGRRERRAQSFPIITSDALTTAEA